jgi:hypothetical protein
VLALQQDKPEWLKKKLNGHALLKDEKPEAKSLLDSITSAQLTKEIDQEPTWIVPNLILENALNGFFGDGATGKDLLLLQLALAMTNDKTFLGMKVKQGRVLYINTEDSKRHLRFRQKKIMGHFNLSEGNDDLRIVIMKGQKETLWAQAGKGGKVIPTPLYAMQTDRGFQANPGHGSQPRQHLQRRPEQRFSGTAVSGAARCDRRGLPVHGDHAWTSKLGPVGVGIGIVGQRAVEQWLPATAVSQLSEKERRQ